MLEEENKIEEMLKNIEIIEKQLVLVEGFIFNEPFSFNEISNKLKEIAHSWYCYERDKENLIAAKERIRSSGINLSNYGISEQTNPPNIPTLSEKKRYYIETLNKFQKETITPSNETFRLLLEVVPNNEKISSLLDRCNNCEKEIQNIKTVINNDGKTEIDLENERNARVENERRKEQDKIEEQKREIIKKYKDKKSNRYYFCWNLFRIIALISLVLFGSFFGEETRKYWPVVFIGIISIILYYILGSDSDFSMTMTKKNKNIFVFCIIFNISLFILLLFFIITQELHDFTIIGGIIFILSSLITYISKYMFYRVVNDY